MYIDMFPSVFETIPAICFNVRESVSRPEIG